MRLILASLAVVLMAGCVGTNFRWDRARAVEVGMTEQQVQALLGPPHTVTTRGVHEIWVYASASGGGASRTVSYVFEDGRVVDVPRIPETLP